MQSGRLRHRVKFYAKVTTRDDYGSSQDTWPTATIITRCELRWTSGNRILENEEKIYTKNMEIIIRYRTGITETMRVQLDETSDRYWINYIEELGYHEGLRIGIEKLNLGI